MTWIIELERTQPVAFSVLVMAAVAMFGLAFGSFKVRGISLGIAGVLFAGIVAGHLGLKIDPNILNFTRDFGLILFVYTIGMQVGPGFTTSLRKQGLPLNLMAAGIVVGGALVALAISYFGHVDIAAAVGLFAGATTNTPALGAATEALKSIPNLSPDRLELPALGYAVAYPFGVMGIILTMILIRSVCRIDVEKEADAFRRDQKAGLDPLEHLNVVVQNENLVGLQLDNIPGRKELNVVVSRIKRAGADSPIVPAYGDTVLQRGDILLVVGTKSQLQKFGLIVGEKATLDLLKIPSDVVSRRIVVTHKEVLGKTLLEVGLGELYGVIVSRVTRADMEMTAVPELKLQFGDMLMVVGEEDDIKKASNAVGNSLKELNHTNLIPVFLGIALGLVIGTYPLTIGDMPAPVRLGIAGGPLLAAIILSRIGRIGPLVWYIPVNANMALRELGIVLFLACVGLKAGQHFVSTLLQGDGFYWMACGALITFVPIALMGFLGRLVWKLNYMNLCGLLSGSMTDPPALAFANSVTASDSPSVAYATVYPFTMLLRILLAQLLILIFCR